MAVLRVPYGSSRPCGVNRLGRLLRCLSLRSHDQTGLVYRTSR